MDEGGGKLAGRCRHHTGVVCVPDPVYSPCSNMAVYMLFKVPKKYFIQTIQSPRMKLASSHETYAVQSAPKINWLTRMHSTHAYGFSHAHVPHLTRTKTWSRPGGLISPFPRLNLGRGVHPAYFHAVWGSFEVVFLFFWSSKGQRNLPVGALTLLWTHSLPHTKRAYVIILT